MIKISNEKVADFLMLKLGKLDNNFKKEELETVKSLFLNSKDSYGNDEEIDLRILKYFTNLEELELSNLIINNEITVMLSKLKKLETITFNKCSFENPNVLQMLKVHSLNIVNSDIQDTKFLESLKILKKLSLIGLDNIYIKDINNLINLRYLRLSNSHIIDFKEELLVPNLEELYIDNTNLYEFTLLKIPLRKKLKKLCISDDIYLSNRNYIRNLNDISIYNENMVKYIY
ncbi:MAG: hypothetical protein IIZ67_01165 [Bacilli bacterium]|nr:hypothetical protein [Bacilli bacterium]